MSDLRDYEGEIILLKQRIKELERERDEARRALLWYVDTTKALPLADHEEPIRVAHRAEVAARAAEEDLTIRRFCPKCKSEMTPGGEGLPQWICEYCGFAEEER